MIQLHYPSRSLREGYWFKLICGASFQYLPAIRNLVLAYTLAGADCIDVAADPAVVSTAKVALGVASAFGEAARQRGFGYKGLPWLMVSFNDGEDLHFRKAEFRAEDCPPNCPRPCEAICPAEAIDFSGISSDRCYGCGRCLPVCPVQHIKTRAYVSSPEVITPLILDTGIDAIELHTQVGHLEDFRRLWKAIAPYIYSLKLVAVSCPDGEGLIDYLKALYSIMSPLPCPLVWQTDGRPMSGDIGIGTTRAAVRLSQKVLAAELPGYVQLAGGTNRHTVPKLRSMGLLNPTSILDSELEDKLPSPAPHSLHVAGVAYGSYARTLLAPILNQLETIQTEKTSGENQFALPSQASESIPCDVAFASTVIHSRQTPSFSPRLEDSPHLLWQAVELAESLVSQIKSPLTAR